MLEALILARAHLCKFYAFMRLQREVTKADREWLFRDIQCMEKIIAKAKGEDVE